MYKKQFLHHTGAQQNIKGKKKSLHQRKPLTISPLKREFIQPKSICPCDGGCPRCLLLHAKLKISKPNDPCEQEADRVADEVMRMPESRVQRNNACPECKEQRGESVHVKPLADQITPLVQRQVEPEEEEGLIPESEIPEEEEVPEGGEEEEEPVQPKANPAKTPIVTSSLNTKINSLKGGGQPLPESIRHYFEPRFGADFSKVKIHTDTQAAQAAKSINARAFTIGKNIIFNSGQYYPEIQSGKQLLGHELTHVLQQVTNKTDTKIQRACGPKAVGPTPKECNLVSKVPEGERFLFNVNCDEFAPGEKKRLELYARTFIGKSNKVDILGMASFDGSPSFNESLSCQRAFRTREFLIKIGIPATNIRFVEATGGIRPAHDPSLRAVAINIESSSSLKTKPKQKSKPKPKKVCGPDISQPLRKVFGEIQTTFASWSDWKKNMCCFGLIQWMPFVVNPIEAWDIKELFLPNTGWLYEKPYCPYSYYLPSCHCGIPATGTPGTSSIENAKTSPCGNSVQVSNKCFLAGTANYGTFGIMCKLCRDHSLKVNPWIWPRIQPFWYTEKYMKTLIWLYKTLTGDDPVPPTAWAVATYRVGPSGVSGTENRGHCSGRCSVAYAGKPFDFVWEPHKPR